MSRPAARAAGVVGRDNLNGAVVEASGQLGQIRRTEGDGDLRLMQIGGIDIAVRQHGRAGQRRKRSRHARLARAAFSADDDDLFHDRFAFF